MLLLALALAVVVIYAWMEHARKGPPPSVREKYGAADEPGAGLNPARSLASLAVGWPSFYAPAYRADSASAMSHMMVRD